MTASDLSAKVGIVFRTVRRVLRAFESERVETADGQIRATWNDLELIAEPDELDGGWIAYCPQIPGCVSQGDTETEALRNAAAVATEIIQLRVNDAIAEHRQRHTADAKTHKVSVAI